MSNSGALDDTNTFIADVEDLDELANRPKSNTFTMPTEKDLQQPIDLWIVMRDRRGGMDFGHWQFELADPAE